MNGDGPKTTEDDVAKLLVADTSVRGAMKLKF